MTAKSFETLLKENERVLFKVASVYCPYPDERADLVQEMRLALWRAFASYDATRPFTTWMWRVALNVALSFSRDTRRRKSRIRPLEDAPEIATETDERVALLKSLLARLDEMSRALLMLHLDGHSYAEIAEILGITETNVATKLSRLKQKIREENSENGNR